MDVWGKGVYAGAGVWGIIGDRSESLSIVSSLVSGCCWFSRFFVGRSLELSIG